MPILINLLNSREISAKNSIDNSLEMEVFYMPNNLKKYIFIMRHMRKFLGFKRIARKDCRDLQWQEV